MPSQLTKIVSLGLFVALAACTNKAEPERPTYGTGAQTKTGLALSSQQWCRAPKVDQKGLYTIDRFTFQSNGEFKLARMILNTNSTMTKESEDIGSWALMDNSLVLMQQNRTIPALISPATRPSDGLTCYDLVINGSEDGKTEQICPCSL